ncbi:MAG: SDR family oxidoreductase [Pseudomonadales bacterium]|jgi:pteridine reductase|tara:strand:+ start:875 stop:1603 length:729 start_codon:yes stop_codon:yes gene_type:complete
MAKVKVALITGAAKRLGRALAEHLHQSGWQLALAFGQSKTAAEALAHDLNHKRPNSARLHQANLAEQADVERLIEDIKAHHPHLDLIINNAAIFPSTPFGHTSPEQWDQILGVNLKAPFMICQGLAPIMGPASSIINICDVFGEKPLRNHSVYSASKAGLMMLTKSLALELAPRIRVNAIAPGALLAPAGYEEAGFLTDLIQRTPLNHLGGQDCLASIVTFLIDNHYITGQVIPIDGGLSTT